jgi:HK97 gp10 family phage protein
MARVVVHAHRVDQLFRQPNGPTGRYLWSVGLGVESRAKTLAPVRTGRLRASIRATAPVLRGGRLTVQVGSDVNYSHYQEVGTRFMPGRHYLRDALRR